MPTFLGSPFNDLLFGSKLADTIYAGDGHDRLFGLAGDDQLYGESGNDTLDGGTGENRLAGGKGIDTVSYADAERHVNVDLGSGGSDGLDRVDLLFSIENAIGSAFEDAIEGTDGANVLRGGGGSDFLYGVGGKDTLDGEAGDDFLHAGFGNDTLLGGVGNDFLHGEGDDDVLIGGAGRDRMTGGPGRDKFVYEQLTDSLGAEDRILDFARGQDRIDVAQIDADSTRTGNQAFAFLGLATAFTAPGQLLYFQVSTLDGSTTTFVQLNTDLDPEAESSLALASRHALEAADFVL